MSRKVEIEVEKGIKTVLEQVKTKLTFKCTHYDGDITITLDVPVHLYPELFAILPQLTVVSVEHSGGRKQ